MNRRTILTAIGGGSLAMAWNPDRLYAAAASGDWTLAVGDVEHDIAPTPLKLVHGRAPASLEGVLYRNGPAKFHRPGGSAGHWFDGDGMVRRFVLADGKATLAARFVDTRKRRVDAAAEAVVSGGFGTPAQASVSSPDDVNAANISVLRAGDQLWALWEAGSPTVLDPASLETRGLKTLRPDLKGMPFLAHPRYEPGGRIWNLGVAGKAAVVWRLGPDGELEEATPVELPTASYVHDFTATDRHLVIVLQPWFQERFALPLLDGFAWRPEQGTKILVLDKADLTRRRVYETDPFFAFHMGDAWEESDGTIRFDICADIDPGFATDGAKALLQGRRPPPRLPELRLLALRPDSQVTVERTGLSAEFPRTDPLFAGQPRTFTVCAGGGRGDNPLFQSIRVQDWKHGRAESFDFGPGQLVEEAVFVLRPGRSREFDGWLLVGSINLDAKASELHVLDARRPGAGPICTWRADIALPISLHGVFAKS